MIITLEKHIYDCGLWQTSGLPCRHVMPCIARMKCTYEKYIAPYYSTEAYLRCYSNMIHLLPEKYKCPHKQAKEILPQMFKGHPVGSKHLKKDSFISQWLIREDSKHVVNYVELFTIIEDIALLIQPMHIRNRKHVG